MLARSGGQPPSRTTRSFRNLLVEHHADEERQRVVRQQRVRLGDLAQVEAHRITVASSTRRPATTAHRPAAIGRVRRRGAGSGHVTSVMAHINEPTVAALVAQLHRGVPARAVTARDSQGRSADRDSCSCLMGSSRSAVKTASSPKTRWKSPRASRSTPTRDRHLQPAPGLQPLPGVQPLRRGLPGAAVPGIRADLQVRLLHGGVPGRFRLLRRVQVPPRRRPLRLAPHQRRRPSRKGTGSTRSEGRPPPGRCRYISTSRKPRSPPAGSRMYAAPTWSPRNSPFPR